MPRDTHQNVRHPLRHKTKSVKLYRWRPSFKFGNFGDELTPLILERLLGVTGVCVPLRQAELIGAGSLLDAYDLCPMRKRVVDRVWSRFFGPRDLHIWGTGFLRRDTRMRWPRRVHVHALRGALTGKRLGVTGVVQADPGILASLLVDRPAARSFLCMVPHWRDYEWVERHFAPHFASHWRLVNPLAPVDTVLEEIGASECVVSSSLHGLIVADSFNKPCVWASVNEAFDGTFKFEDYQTTRRSPFNVPIPYDVIAQMPEQEIERTASRAGRNMGDWQRDLLATFPFS